MVLAAIADPEATDLAYAAGLGGRLATPVGATLDPSGGPPLDIDGVVSFLAEVREPAERQAVVRIGGLSLVLTAKRRPFHCRRDFTALGLDPTKASIVVVKSGYLSPEISELAAANIMALSPGAVDQDITRLPRLRQSLPTYPFDPDVSWRPVSRPSARTAIG